MYVYGKWTWTSKIKKIDIQIISFHLTNHWYTHDVKRKLVCFIFCKLLNSLQVLVPKWIIFWDRKCLFRIQPCDFSVCDKLCAYICFQLSTIFGFWDIAISCPFLLHKIKPTFVSSKLSSCLFISKSVYAAINFNGCYNSNGRFEDAYRTHLACCILGKL